MSWKLLAGFACGMTLLLGACSGNNASGTTVVTPGTGGGDSGGSDGGGDSGGSDGGGDSGGSDGAEPTEPDAAEKAYMDAVAAVMRATAAARSATPATRDTAIMLIATARAELAKAVTAAEAAVAAAEGPAAVGAAARALNKAKRYQTNQETALDTARASFAWYGKDLVRYTFASGDVVVPREGTNVATIKRIPRTVTVNNVVVANTGQQEGTEAAFTSSTFKDHMYSEGKRVFSTADDDEGGDEFKVDGYVGWLDSDWTIEFWIHTGVKLTDAGLVIRTGGSALGSSQYQTDYTDMRRDITQYANLAPAGTPRGQNGWDLEIAFDEPQTKTVANGHASWTGNGAFYWKSIVPADPSQLETDGDYYRANAFNQREGYKDLGTYDVWLSNHIGVDTRLEPAPGTVATCPDGSRGTSCPDDDVNLYLNYAAYGLFVYTVDPQTYGSNYNGRVSRINTLHFGYSAFDDADGKKTTDIGEPITSGKFHGHTLAYETQGGRRNTINTKMLRGDATLTVTIPKGTGAGTVEGTLSNFQRWHDEGQYWTTYIDDDFMIALSSSAIDEDGTFNGNLQATPNTGLARTGTGIFRGSFYGPRADVNDLEIAGSYHVGPGTSSAPAVPDSSKVLYGTFGAKQTPAAVPASN